MSGVAGPRHAAGSGVSDGAGLDCDVLICGGGPVGLALAYLLGREGLRVTLFEQRPGTTPLPKGQYVHASTAELYRQWGVWERLERAGWPLATSNGQGFYTRVSLGPLADVRAADGSEAEYAQKWSALTPVYPRKIPASEYEAALLHQASGWPGVRLLFGQRVADVDLDAGGVAVEIHEGPGSGTARRVRGRYLVACDGAHSLVRNRLGQGEDHGPAFGNQVLTEFRADLDDTLGRDGYFHSFILDPRYAGWFGAKDPRTGLWRYSFRHEEDALPEPDVVLARLRGALGMPDLPIELIRTHRFDYTTGLLRRWREGRVFFAGDAAHWHSPWGGYGANIGVQDANNLAWKLALVLRGAANDRLLDTYETERKPKAVLAVKAATYNSLNFQAMAQAAVLAEPELAPHGTVSEQGIAFLRDCIEAHGANSVLHTGFQLGTVYESSAVIRDGATPPRATLSLYVESTVPGVRAPHAWLRDAAGRRLSTVDLWGPWFTLFAGRASLAWHAAARSAEETLGVNLRVVAIGGDDAKAYVPEDGKFEQLYALTSGDALLVRPDGYVACRLAARDAAQPGDLGGLLCERLMRLLARA